MRNEEVARIFRAVAELLELKGENPFRARAYERAAEKMARLGEDIAAVAEKGQLTSIPGIGKELAAKIEEILRTGSLGYYEKLKAEIPPGVLELLTVPGIGPRKAMALYRELGVKGLEDLEARARAAEVRRLPGFKERTEANILREIRGARQVRERIPLGEALPIALGLVEMLRQEVPGARISIAGSLRRRCETIGDIDLLAASPRPEQTIASFVALSPVAEVLARGETKATVRLNDGRQVDLRAVEPVSYGAALCYFTGSKDHNIHLRRLALDRGLKINEYGVFHDGKSIAGREEEEVYAALGLPWIPPELREDRGEIEAAAAGRLPALVTDGDIRGDLHVHSVYSDGTGTLESIADRARRLGYEWVALCDHSPSLKIAHGLSIADLRAKAAAVRAFNAASEDFHFLCGTEVDIKPDGTLDYPDEVLAGLDFVVAAVHSRFRQKRELMTERLLAGVRHPLVHALAHPTGRLLGERPPYSADIEQVIAEACAAGTWLEINAYPKRLDLSDHYCRLVKERGGLLTIGSDAHTVGQMDFIAYGVSVARRGWLEPRDIVNTRSWTELRALFAREGRNWHPDGNNL
ncbi:MAG: DNA polymerase/3'-5' exonuclease PolX [Bacillota bacterium]|nr:DNA polymerase/3'-5' exonuclease PolX [Bacillota bacterium]